MILLLLSIVVIVLVGMSHKNIIRVFLPLLLIAVALIATDIVVDNGKTLQSYIIRITAAIDQ